MRNCMKNSQLIILGIFFGLISCNNHGKKNNKLDSYDFKIPVVIDTFKTYKSEQVTFWRQIGNYRILYIGQNKDSIYVYAKVANNPNHEKYFVSNTKIEYYHKHDSLGILLLIDTTKVISNFSIPVFIVNTTRDTLNMGYGTYLPIIMEAIDLKGKWRPIEDRFFYTCGFGLNEIILPPNEIVVTSAPLYMGKFKTKLRLRYNNTISAEFSGSISITQFDPEWDENGKRKPKPAE